MGEDESLERVGALRLPVDYVEDLLVQLAALSRFGRGLGARVASKKKFLFKVQFGCVQSGAACQLVLTMTDMFTRNQRYRHILLDKEGNLSQTSTGIIECKKIN